MQIEKSDLIRELKSENVRCSQYINYMYQVLQFTFLAIIALTVCGFSNEVTDEGFKIIFKLVLPVCFYIFGIMYAFNAYAVAKCGRREELIHAAIFDIQWYKERTEAVFLDRERYSLIIKNVVVDRKISMLSYGVPLGFYIVLPVASIIIGNVMHKEPTKLPFFMIEVLPICGIIIYYILMSIVISKIIKEHFTINKIQKEIREKVESDALN